MAEDERESRGIPLMVLATLLLFLIALGYPAWRYYTASADRNATLALVHSLATAITTYPDKTMSWDLTTPAGTKRMTEFLWDLNHDGHVDGSPAVTTSATTDGGFPSEVIATGYAGYYAMVRPTMALRFLNRRHQPMDAWGNLLRIRFAPYVYGSHWFGIWSAGPDGIDGTADDLNSWR